MHTHNSFQIKGTSLWPDDPSCCSPLRTSVSTPCCGCGLRDLSCRPPCPHPFHPLTSYTPATAASHWSWNTRLVLTARPFHPHLRAFAPPVPSVGNAFRLVQFVASFGSLLVCPPLLEAQVDSFSFPTSCSPTGLPLWACLLALGGLDNQGTQGSHIC